MCVTDEGVCPSSVACGCTFLGDRGNLGCVPAHVRGLAAWERRIAWQDVSNDAKAYTGDCDPVVPDDGAALRTLRGATAPAIGPPPLTYGRTDLTRWPRPMRR